MVKNLTNSVISIETRLLGSSDTHGKIWTIETNLNFNEFIVSLIARRYTRVVNGRERLVLCLSDYLPLRIVYRISSMSTIA